VEVRYADNQENVRYYEANRHIERSEWVLTHRCYPAAERLRAGLARHSEVAR
jgi:glycine/serine hydroxymethyltransferase